MQSGDVVFHDTNTIFRIGKKAYSALCNSFPAEFQKLGRNTYALPLCPRAKVHQFIKVEKIPYIKDYIDTGSGFTNNECLLSCI